MHSWIRTSDAQDYNSKLTCCQGNRKRRIQNPKVFWIRTAPFMQRTLATLRQLPTHGTRLSYTFPRDESLAAEIITSCWFWPYTSTALSVHAAIQNHPAITTITQFYPFTLDLLVPLWFVSLTGSSGSNTMKWISPISPPLKSFEFENWKYSCLAC